MLSNLVSFVKESCHYFTVEDFMVLFSELAVLLGYRHKSQCWFLLWLYRELRTSNLVHILHFIWTHQWKLPSQRRWYDLYPSSRLYLVFQLRSFCQIVRWVGCYHSWVMNLTDFSENGEVNIRSFCPESKRFQPQSHCVAASSLQYMYLHVEY